MRGLTYPVSEHQKYRWFSIVSFYSSCYRLLHNRWDDEFSQLSDWTEKQQHSRGSALDIMLVAASQILDRVEDHQAAWIRSY